MVQWTLGTMTLKAQGNEWREFEWVKEWKPGKPGAEERERGHGDQVGEEREPDELPVVNS